jgi:hypothetical protein
MFVILTSKTGQYRTEIGDGLRACEAYAYLFHGREKAHFVIAELQRDTRVRIVDEAPPAAVNEVPSKFLQKFASVEAARRQLEALVSFGKVRATLARLP